MFLAHTLRRLRNRHTSSFRKHSLEELSGDLKNKTENSERRAEISASIDWTRKRLDFSGKNINNFQFLILSVLFFAFSVILLMIFYQ